MASHSNSLLSEENFLCSICLDVFTDPITTPCGHNFCKSCITRYWDDTDAVCRCPLCNRTFHRRPEVTVNTFISDMVGRFRSHKLQEQYEGKGEAQVRLMIREREARVREVSLVADGEVANGRRVFAALMSVMERSRAELVRAIEERRKATETQAEGIVRDLRREIAELTRRASELRQLSQKTEDDVRVHNVASSVVTPLLPPSCTKDWMKVGGVHPSSSSYAGTVRTAVAQLEKALSQEMEKLCSAELRRIQQYAGGDATPDFSTYK